MRKTRRPYFSDLLYLVLMKAKLSVLFVFSAFFSFAQTVNYYFGNLHAHTGLSDGSKDSLVSGVSRPDGAYAYAKLSQDFDFLGISEHNHYSANNNPGFKLPGYQVGLNMAAAATQEGTFLALFGMEYGVSSTCNGHVLIYGFNQLLGWEPGNYDIYNAKTDYDGLFRKVKNNPAAFAYLAHPGFSDYTTNGSVSTALAYAPYNAAYDSAIVGMPLRSGLAFSTASDYGDYSQGNYFDYFKKLLSKGYHLGIGYDHDNHYTNFGRSNGGRLVVLAPSLTKPHLFYAMQHMHFYGSDDSNAKVSFLLNGSIMGSVMGGSVYPTLKVTHNDGNGEQADSIKIWKGANDGSGQLPVVIHTALGSNAAAYTDHSLSLGIEYYYFSEVKQADGHWIVTSPVWYKLLSLPASAADHTTETGLHMFPNPVSGHLSISLPEPDQYSVSMYDVCGRPVCAAVFSGRETGLDLSGLAKGVYSLTVRGAKAAATRKLVID